MKPSPLVRALQPRSVPVDGDSGGPPAVSVIISTYNAGNLLANALDALAAQSLPADLVEILVVDDGSTDGTWRYLSEVEGERGNIKIFRQRHSGGPSAGRNRALSIATGSYVFCHDADDYLGPDALRRLVEIAHREDSDIVMVRVSWIGRPNPDPGPAKSVFDADILKDGVWRSLTPHKLIRRSLIERLGLRFCEDMVQGEDQVFMASCLFAARKISVLGDKDLYHRRMLPDGSNLSRQRQTLTNKRLTTARMVGLVVANTTPGLRRDRLLRRVFVRTLPPALNRPFMAAGSEERKEFLGVMQAQVFPYLPHSVLGELEDPQRLRLLTAKIGAPEDLVELNRVLSATVKYGDGELPTYTLGPHLDRLISAEDRQVGAPRLAATPILCDVAASPNQVTIKVSLEEAGALAGRLSLAAWHCDRPDFVDLGSEVARAGSTLTFTISAPQLEHKEINSSDDPEERAPQSLRWLLLLQAQRRGTTIAASPIIWPSDTFQPVAGWAVRATRNPRIQLGATPRGSVVVKALSPRERA